MIEGRPGGGGIGVTVCCASVGVQPRPRINTPMASLERMRTPLSSERLPYSTLVEVWRAVLLNIGKCLTFRFLLHRGRFHGSPGTDVSAFLSTGCHRGTRGEVHQVDCGVAIPIVDDAAFNA